MVKDFKGDVEKACVMRKKLKEDRVCAEAMHDVLVDNLKDDLCRVTHNSKDEVYLAVEDTMKNIEK